MKIRKSLWLSLCFQIMISGSAAFISSAEAAPAANVQGTSAKMQGTAAVPKASVQVSGPFCSENLAIYLIRGPQKIKGTVLTLGEALAKKQAMLVN